MPARLQGYKGLPAPRTVPGGGEGRDFGVVPAEFGMPSLTDDPLVAHDDTSHQRIWMDTSPATLAESHGLFEKGSISEGEGDGLRIRFGHGPQRRTLRN
jgi:hypothetical protein